MTFFASKIFLPAALLASMLVINSCDSQDTKEAETKMDNMADSADKKIDNARGKGQEVISNATTAVETELRRNPDSSFGVEALLDNNEEINMLEAATHRAASKAVKSAAGKMLTHHKGLKQKLEKYLEKKNYPATPRSSSKSQKILDDISSKPGAEWDKAWAEHMLFLHEKAIGEFDGARLNDESLKAIIEQALPTLRSHLDMIKKLREDIK